MTLSTIILQIILTIPLTIILNHFQKEENRRINQLLIPTIYMIIIAALIPAVKENFVFGKAEENDENDLKLCAKIVYDSDLVKETYGTDNEEEIKQKIWEKVKEVNKQMPNYKYIKEIIITDKELIKTTTQKVKRFEEIKTIK